MAKPTKTKAPTRRKSTPLPSLVAPKTVWQIKEARPGAPPQTDLGTGTMSVPLGVAGVDRALRNREMVRVKFSPKKLARGPDIDPNTMEACEQGRANWRGYGVGVDIGRDVATFTIEDAKAYLDSTDELGAINGLIPLMQTTYTDQATMTQAILDKYGEGPGRTLIRNANDAYWKATGRYRAKPGPKAAVDAAKWLTMIYKPPPDEPDEHNQSGQPDKSNSPSEVREALQDRIAKFADFSALEKEEKEMQDRVTNEDGEGEGKPPENLMQDHVGQDRTWCTMKITEPKRTVRFPSKMRGRSWKATDQGVVLRYPHRWAADKTMFAARAQKPGGCTVLIDASGSMHFTGEQIFQIMKLMPAATIAAYNGGTHEGELRILAKKGRRVDDAYMKPPHGGNGVDGPALDWLAKHPGPRYWVSDGIVFGYCGKRTPGMLAAVYKHCRDHHILRIDSLQEVIERFK